MMIHLERIGASLPPSSENFYMYFKKNSRLQGAPKK